MSQLSCQGAVDNEIALFIDSNGKPILSGSRKITFPVIATSGNRRKRVQETGFYSIVGMEDYDTYRLAYVEDVFVAPSIPEVIDFLKSVDRLSDICRKLQYVKTSKTRVRVSLIYQDDFAWNCGDINIFKDARNGELKVEHIPSYNEGEDITDEFIAEAIRSGAGSASPIDELAQACGMVDRGGPYGGDICAIYLLDGVHVMVNSTTKHSAVCSSSVRFFVEKDISAIVESMGAAEVSGTVCGLLGENYMRTYQEPTTCIPHTETRVMSNELIDAIGNQYVTPHAYGLVHNPRHVILAWNFANLKNPYKDFGSKNTSESLESVKAEIKAFNETSIELAAAEQKRKGGELTYLPFYT